MSIDKLGTRIFKDSNSQYFKEKINDYIELKETLKTTLNELTENEDYRRIQIKLKHSEDYANIVKMLKSFFEKYKQKYQFILLTKIMIRDEFLNSLKSDENISKYERNAIGLNPNSIIRKKFLNLMKNEYYFQKIQIHKGRASFFEKQNLI